MNILLKTIAATLTTILCISVLWAEGSKDLVADKGYRLFLNVQQKQQIKVYAQEGEYIQVGSSHVGVAGGFIRVYRPDGALHAVFNNAGATTGQAIIYNRTQELAGPTGGGSLNGPGYVPGVVPVSSKEEGVWTILFEYPSYSTSAFQNVLNTANWLRVFDQPVNQRVVLAWDVTVSQKKPANDGGEMLTGRVFTQEYISVINDNGHLTDTRFFVLTDEGIQYRLDLEDIDPWAWFVSSNSRGIVTHDKLPTQRSHFNTNYIRSWLPNSWKEGERYMYEPQTRDTGPLRNNKLFFNPPDPDMPAEALVTDLYRNLTYMTWLNPAIPDFDEPLSEVGFSALAGPDGIYSLCGGQVMGVGQGGYITLNTSGWGQVELLLDINGNGVYTDSVDVLISKGVTGGPDSLFWDGLDGLGTPVPAQDSFALTILFNGVIYVGEMHIHIFDVENIAGGIELTRLNTANSGVVPQYFDHSPIGGAVSGGGTPGNAMPTSDKYTFSGNLGNEALMDHWTFLSADPIDKVVTIYIDIVDSCVDPDLDSDGDGIIDIFDLDDDNDGIPDSLEYCNGTGFWCLPGGLDPSGDEDGDRIPNYLDADDPAFDNPCEDLDGDGICDFVHPIYDSDGDGIPNHLDHDSDNDGIADLEEAGHGAPDLNRDGMIDGPPALFGDNGLYNEISNKPNGRDAVVTYTLLDKDSDGVRDFLDRDADNDGIHDCAEVGLGHYDTNNDGAIDRGDGEPLVDKWGVPVQISPTLTGEPFPGPFDFDEDGVKNQHDRDSDNDGIPDVTEAELPDPDGDGIPGMGIPVVNAWGIPVVDAIGQPIHTTSHPPNTDGEAGADFVDLDSDDDGVPDTYEAFVVDPDYDGFAGFGVPVVDAFGIPYQDQNGDPIFTVSDPPDHDGDGIPNYKDIDSDNDGISDGYECYDFKNNYTTLPCLDTDGDGIPDMYDLDSDSDGLPDAVECPNGNNPDCPDSSGNGIDDFRDPNLFVNTDTDGDGIPDRIDLDNDNDGIPDWYEFCEGGGWWCLPGGVDPDGDEDGDFIPNYMDADDPAVNNPCVDANGDGICDRVHRIYDSDGDGIPNHNDLDSDNDGIPDMYEAGHNVEDITGNGMIDGPPIVFGANGLYNPISTHPDALDATITYVVRDTDGDGVYDFLDLDSDNDGIFDVAENDYQAWDSNNDGRVDNGAGHPDIGWMGIPRVVNSVWTGLPIPQPRDSDGDGIPNYRDLDSDNDGIYDVTEQMVADPDNDGLPGLSPLTVNEYGAVIADATSQVFTSTSILIDTDQDGRADFVDHDSDGDTIPDVLEGGHQDPDQDGIPGVSPVTVDARGALLADANGEPIFSTSEVRDLDGDGFPDFQDRDRDGDGISDGYECVFPYACVDTDGDGIPDVDDLNSDGDCETDAEECPGGDPCPDSNGNGTPDFRWFDCCADFEPVLDLSAAELTACTGRPLTLTGQNTNFFPADLTYTWTGPGFSYTNTVKNQAPLTATLTPTLSSPGTYTLKVVTSQGCSGDDATIELQVKPTPAKPGLQVFPDEICIGDEIILSTNQYTGPGLLYEWYFHPGGGQPSLVGTSTTPMLIIAPATPQNNGFYSVVVTVDGCASDAASDTPAFVLPQADLQANDDHFTLYIEDILLEGNVLNNDLFNTQNVLVRLGDGPANGKVNLFVNGNFRYTVNPGFFGLDSFSYEICGELCQFDCDTAWVYINANNDNIPDDCEPYNIITPNNDGSNDFFVIPCLYNYPDHELRIFNRWGNQVYFTTQYQQNWDGNWNGRPLPPGTYFYTLTIFGSHAKEKQGYLTIIR